MFFYFPSVYIYGILISLYFKRRICIMEQNNEMQNDQELDLNNLLKIRREKLEELKNKRQKSF